MHLKVLSDRVQVEQRPGFIQIEVLGRLEQWKMTLLTTWLVAWLFCGAFFAYALIAGMAGEEGSVALLIMLSFWAYFAYTIGKSWRFKSKGAEVLRIEGAQVQIGRRLGENYFLKPVPGDTRLRVEPVKLKPTDFFGAMQASWWLLGGEKLLVKSTGTSYPFGMHLSESETRSLQALLQKKLS